MMTSAQVVETSVNVTNNSPSRDYSHPDEETTQTIHWKAVEQYFTVVLFVFHFFPVYNLGKLFWA